MTVERLSWASGSDVREGWHHSDIEEWPGMDAPPVSWQSPGSWPWRDHVGDISHTGLPWEDGAMDYVVSHHGLMMLPEPDLIPALSELRRVTKPGGWLRVSVPDIEGAIYARNMDMIEWFPLDAPDIETAFCRYLTQNGATRSIFTAPRLRRLMAEAGWNPPKRYWTDAGVTDSPWPDITELDSRPNESIFMEGVNGG